MSEIIFTLDQLNKLIAYFSNHCQRVAYSALGSLFGLAGKEFGEILGARCWEKSFIVRKNLRRPTGYSRQELDPRLIRILEAESVSDKKKALKAKINNPVLKTQVQILKFLKRTKYK